MQKILNPDQLAAFYHDQFVRDQTQHFQALVALDRVGFTKGRDVIVDLGGGVGFFAHAVKSTLGHAVRVIDMDAVSIQQCTGKGLDARVGDAVRYAPEAHEKVACFNLILHHLIGNSIQGTYDIQSQALANWRGGNRLVFVNEYIYESFIPGFSGLMIYAITRSKLLSAVGRMVSKVVPAFKANTFGVGVRFRSDREWVRLFEQAGFKVVAQQDGADEHVSPPLRLMLIRSIKRSSYVLTARN